MLIVVEHMFVLAYYASFLVFLAHKYRRHLGPVHLFELKALLDMTVRAAVFVAVDLVMMLDPVPGSTVCRVTRVTEYASILCWLVFFNSDTDLARYIQ